jgi:hypothetical protein
MPIKCKPAKVIWYERPHVVGLYKGDCADCFKLLPGVLHTRREQHNVCPVNLREHKVSVVRETRNKAGYLNAAVEGTLLYH